MKFHVKMEDEPDQFVPNPCSGICTVEEGEPSVTLRLGFGNGEVKDGMVLKFRPEQLSELKLQRLIFNYMAAGLTVPPQLLVLICNSFGSISQRYSSFVTGFSGQDFHHSMDPYAWRCRKTDGKKWRCSKHVVVDRKFCERHMGSRGRGRRQCSRKHVEVSQSDLSPNTVANHTVPVAAISELNKTVAHSKANNDNAITSNAGVCIVDNENERKNHGIDGKGDSHHIGGNAIGVGHNTIMRKNIGLSLSSKNVRQGNTASRSSSKWPRRCLRSDGKKWRCSRDVIPGKKYCEWHENAKKPVIILKTATATAAAPNTYIPVSIPTTPRLSNNNENATTSSSGDTTISDASDTVFENGTVSSQVRCFGFG